MEFITRGYAVVYTDIIENIDRIKKIIENYDSDEYRSIPKNLIKVFDFNKINQNRCLSVEYSGKFFDCDDFDIIVDLCKKESIPIVYKVSDDDYVFIDNDFIKNAFEIELITREEGLTLARLECFI